MVEVIIKDIIDRGAHFEVLVENPDLTLTGHTFLKGNGWEEEVSFSGVSKPRWLIKLEQKYQNIQVQTKMLVKGLEAQKKKWVGKRFKDGKLQD